MPDGVVQWFDEDRGEGRILHAGKRYVVRSEDTEPAARVAGARVHFDVQDEMRAVDVRMRSGRRTSKRQRRFGDLTGAGRTDDKGDAPFATAQPELGHDLQRHPTRVIEQWAGQLAAENLDQAMLLYAPNAALHAGGDVMVGADAIRGFLEGSPLLGQDAEIRIRGSNGDFVLEWSAVEGLESPVARFRVAHGEILEQHLGEVRVVEEPEETPPASLEISTSGPVDDADVAYALDKVRKVLDGVDGPVLHTDVRLVLAPDPARERPAIAKVTIDLDGSPIRSHVAAAVMTEAVDLLADRLRRRFAQLSGHRQMLRRRGPTSGDGQWRHGDQTVERPEHHPRPPDERAVVRHKSFEPEETTIDEAVFDLEAMDFDFCLFHDLASGRDAVVHREEGGGYVVRYVYGPDPSALEIPSAAVVRVDERPAPTLDLAEARERLDNGRERWVFFEDTGTGRGHVIYLRYDGHYGVIVPIDEAEPADVWGTGEDLTPA